MQNPHLLTASGIRTFHDCPQKYAFRYIHKIEELKKSPAMRFGTDVHAGLESYWLARQRRASNPLRAAWEMLPADMDPFEMEKARILLTAYAAVWGPAKVEVIGAEIPFNLPLYDPITNEEHPFFRRAGKIDLVLRQSDGKILLVEHKTTSDSVEAGGAYRRRLHLDEQISYYFDACEAMDIKADVIVYDVLKKPTEKPYKATKNVKIKKNGEPYKNQRARDETVEEYGERVMEDVDANPGDYIVRIPVYRLSAEQSKIKESIWKNAQTISYVTENDLFTENSHACQRTYGACPFLGVCEGSALITDTRLFRVMKNAHPELGSGLVPSR